MHSHDIHTAFEQVFQKAFELYQQVYLWLHFNADIYVTSILLLSS